MNKAIQRQVGVHYLLRWNKWKWLAFLAILALLLDFSLAALFLHDQKADDLYFRCQHNCFHHSLLPNKDCQDVWFDIPYRMSTNSIGFKGKSGEKVAPKINKKRILFLGDSFTEGIGLRYEETFTGLLAARFPEIEILNAGVASYSPKLYWLKTKYLIEIEKLRIDKLVVMLDMSDIQDEVIYETYLPALPDAFNPSLDSKKRNPAYVFLANHSILCNRIFRLKEANKLETGDIGTAAKTNGYNNLNDFWELRDDWTQDSLAWEQWGKKGVELASQNLGQLINYCRQYGIELSLVIYPWKNQIKRKETNSAHVRIWQAFAQKHRINFIDLFPAFFKQSPDTFCEVHYIFGDVHWNKNGHLFVADLLMSSQLFNSH